MRLAKPPRPTIRVTTTQRFTPEPLVKLVSPAPSPPSPTVERTAPPTSTRARLVGVFFGIHTTPTASAPAATGRSIRKVARHDPWSRIAPAIAGATPLATSPAADQMPTARAFLSAGKECPSTERPLGRINASLKPWRNLPTTSGAKLGAKLIAATLKP